MKWFAPSFSSGSSAVARHEEVEMKTYALAISFGMVLALLLVAGPVAAQDLADLTDEEILAVRWLAMADFYARNGMLNDGATYWVEADECLCFRWLAMARFYEQNGLLVYGPENPYDFDQGLGEY
jgi:hypothetical protein